MSATPGSSNATTGAGGGTASSSASNSGHPNKRQRLERASWRGTDILPLRKYTPTPTSGTAPLHSLQDFGHADFYPARAGQSESQLSERSIRYGYVDVPRVDYEHASGHEVVYERLQDARVFQELQAFAAGTAQRQWARGSIASADLPRLSNRIVRSDERRDEWLRSLANARVPLSILANSMPFGLRGERLLECLRAHHVPLQRALWAIRLTGVYEMVGMQTRAPDHASLKGLESQYTVQWSKHFTQFLEHTLDSAPTGAADMSAAPTPSNMAATPSNAAALAPGASLSWPRGWEFCLALLHAQYSQGLLDQRHLVSWLVGQFRHAAVDKCMVILPLVQDYTLDVGKSRTPLRKLIGAVAHRIEQTERYPSLHSFHHQLCRYLIRLFTTFSDAFVEPTTWNAYRRALDLAGKRAHGSNIPRDLDCLVKRVDHRNLRFSCLIAKPGSPPSGERRGGCSAVAAPLRALSTLTPDSDIEEAFDALFGSSVPSETALAAHVIRVVCYWAVEDQISPASTQFRLLAAAQLCKAYIARQPDASSSDVQRAVVDFLDIFALPAGGDGGGKPRDPWRVCSLLERLADVGSFSLSKYLQLLTARGDFFGSNFDTPRSQRHFDYVLHVPLNSAELREQRQMLLYDCEANANGGIAESSAAEIAMLRSEISEMLPMLMAYSCATPVRARNSDKLPVVDVDVVRWWVPDAFALKVGLSDRDAIDLLDNQHLPTATDFTGSRLCSPLAHTACIKDWIAPVSDHAADEPELIRDLSPELLHLLHTSPRNAVDFVVNQRLMPLVYDYVVKDVKVGVDNWRVITRPGTSLLNRRQMAVVVRVLAEAGLFCQLLDFMLWVLDHTTTAPVLSLSHRVLRRYTHVWIRLGRLPVAVAAVEKVRKGANGNGSDTFDFELYRTAQCWAGTGGAEALTLAEQAQRDYDAYVSLHVSSLLQGGHATLPASASKDILQLAQQLTRERTREPSGSDEAEWAILPCFQKLGRWAQSATAQRGSDFAASPAMAHDTPSSPPGGVAATARLPKLQAMLAHLVADATQAALVTSRTLPLAPSGSPDRVRDQALLRCHVEMCAQLVHWFAVCSGLALSPDYIGVLLLKAMAAAIGSWTLTRSSPPPNVLAAAPTAPLLLESEIEAAMHVSYIWVNCLLASGCLRLDDLIPWLIEMCREDPTQQNLAQFTCLAGIVCALGMPVLQQGETRAASLAGDSSSGTNGDNYSASCDLRHMYELLEVGASWQAALDGNRLCRIQAIELVFTSASASGRLRGLGAPRLATTLMRATTALAQSEWIMAIVDHIPFSQQTTSPTKSNGDLQRHGPYYSMLEIYQANIEGQIHDPAIMLPVKRAILRVLMTLCEGTDPASEGFSAMTTAEVAHRLCETIRRFWYGPAASGSQTAVVSKLATILNSLLLFASTALQESEASTDAFAVAAGAKAIAGDVREGPRSGDIDCDGAHRSHDSEQVQFVTNTMAYLSTCVLDAAYNWGAGDAPPSVSKRLASQRCASLAEALCTLSPGVLLTLVESCVGSLFSLSLATLRTTVEGVDQSIPLAAAATGGTELDERVAAIVSAFSVDASCLLEINTADYSGMELDEECGDARNDDAVSFAAYSERGSALAKLIQQLVQRLVLHVDTGSDKTFAAGGSVLAALRDLASAILGQIQAICLHISPVAAAQLKLQACNRQANFGAHSTSTNGGTEEPVADPIDPSRLRAALGWRLQVVRPMCNLFRLG
ncbi:hypothetical protein GGI20_004817 [Coemansia sp. BCRC 34301]|nr:hypothetical protein GGI20_004817 [Coemansia sp. BCRC 34301]